MIKKLSSYQNGVLTLTKMHRKIESSEKNNKKNLYSELIFVHSFYRKIVKCMKLKSQQKKLYNNNLLT